MNPTYGITSPEAKEKQQKYGLNIIEDSHKSPIYKKFIEQISSFLTILLILAAILSFFIGEVLDGSLILTIILLNAGFGIYQEFKAEAAVAALKQLSVSAIRVYRDGKEQEIDSTQLVPGDVYIIEEGVKLPADARVIEARNLEINEAALTGESIPVTKRQDDELYMGTIVAKGRALAHVTATGMHTRFGQIAEKLSSVETMTTPLQKKLTRLTQVIGIGGIILSGAVFVLSAIQGNGYFPSFLLAISLAVAVVPESLPAVMTVILSIGVNHMAGRAAIVRKLSAIEALGNTTLIATDKTGTLTQNKMTVRELYVDGRTIEADAISKHHSQALSQLLLDGVLCATASLVDLPTDGESEVLGDPTEGALLLLARSQGMSVTTVRTEWELIDELPFDSITKRMAVVVKKDQTLLLTKGAPESILSISSHLLRSDKIVRLTKERQEEIGEVLKKWSAEGLRVLAFAAVDVSNKSDIVNTLKKYHEEDLVFLGMAAIHDPPRQEAKDAIVRARSAGIEVVMITGDNEKTAEAIGQRIGLMKPGDVIVKGDQIDGYSDEELMEILPRTRVFARTTPFHKSRIVSLYQKLGEIVTVTGDGVNDAIALKQADVGVAMGRVGTDVARETADMVITDDNFATIVNAVEEGRNIVLRLKNSIKYLLTGNLSEGIVLLGGLLLGFPPILLPIQLLYINLVSDGVPALALGFAPHNEHVMREHPQKELSLLRRNDYEYIVSIGIIVSFILLFLYTIIGSTVSMKETVVFTVLALVQTFIFVDIWFMHAGKKKLSVSIPPIFLLTVVIPIIAQYIIVTVPAIASLFHITAVSFTTATIYTGIACSVLIIVRVLRFIRHLI